MKVKMDDVLLAVNTETGAMVLVHVCSDSDDDNHWVSCDAGTFNTETGKHVCRPFRLIGKVVERI